MDRNIAQASKKATAFAGAAMSEAAFVRGPKAQAGRQQIADRRVFWGQRQVVANLYGTEQALIGKFRVKF